MSLVIPGVAAPNNLRLAEGSKGRLIQSDLYDICSRVAEVSPNLYIVELEGNDQHAFAIMEKCKDGVDRLAIKVKQLDGRVIDRLKYLMSMPLTARLEQLEKDEHRLQEEQKEEELEKLYEQVGDPMRYQFIKDGFADRHSFYGNKNYNRRST